MNLSAKHEKSFTETIKEIYLAIRNTISYPEDHPVSRESVSRSYETLSDLVTAQPMVTISVHGNKVLVDDRPADNKSAFIRGFARDLEQRGIDSVTFYPGLSLKDFKVFLNAMAKSPQDLSQEGGVDSILEKHRVTTIKLDEIKYGRVSEGSREFEDARLAIIDYLSGRSDTLGGYGPTLYRIIEDDPHSVSDLITQVIKGSDMTVDPSSGTARAKVVAEALNRIATELLARQGATSAKFNDTITSILSTCNEDMLMEISQAMQVIETERDQIIDDLASRFHYDAMADICVKEYRRSGQFDMKIVEKLLPSVEEREKILPYVERKLREFAGPDIEEIIEGFLGKAHEEVDIPDYHEQGSEQDERKKIRDDIITFLSEGKNDEIQGIIEDLSKKLYDTSWKTRKNAAESLLEITSFLDKSDKLKGNFQELLGALVNRVGKEGHCGTYLAISENLRRLYASQDRIEGYFINETIGSRLFNANELSKAKLQKALLAQKGNSRSLQYNLGALNLIDEAVLSRFLAQRYPGCRVAHLSEMRDIPGNVLSVIPIRFIKRYLILPFRLDSGNLETAMMNPNDLDVLNDIRFISGYSVVPHLAAEYHLLNALKRFYDIEPVPVESSLTIGGIQGDHGIEFCEEEEEPAPTEELKDSDAPVVRLVNLFIKAAINRKASDIHIEPYENALRVRLRVDGTLATLLTPSMRYSNAITSRIKIMAGLDISERRLPQDGRFKIRMNGNYVDFRVSTFPGTFGEKVVLRLLDNSNLSLHINKLGLNSNDLNTLLTGMYKSKGMILVTGPTGSGKTTTLYSMLLGLNDESRNICTAEDPIEYNLRGINQFQINPKIGLNFARALRTFLRQDPDIIMVGEIRDRETAEIGVKAALTGHLVLSTLHTNSAPETITRLLDMGIEPYLITSSVNLIVAQRLLRKICDRCKVEASPTDLQLKLLKDYGFEVSGRQLFSGQGCEECNNTGYKGRVAIFELMPLWEEIQELILKRKSSLAIRQRTEHLGLVSLQRQGFDKVIEGTTDLAEWVKVVT